MPIVEFERSSAHYYFPNAQGLYPVDALPDLIRNPVLEVSANQRVPIELAAHGALAAVSLGCQNFVDVQCPGFPPAPCSLFLLTVSNSSGGKSLMERRFWRALKEFEDKSAEEAAARMPDYRAELKMWSDDQRRLSSDYRKAGASAEESQCIREQRLAHEKTQPVKPVARELRFAEVSPQGLRDALIANGGLGILSPEGEPALIGMTFSQPAMLSGYWSGEDRPVGLVSGSRRAKGPRLSISIMLQENQFDGYMKIRGDDAFGTGLVARMLPAFPKTFEYPGQQTVTEDLPEPALDRFNERIAEILTQTVPAPEARPAQQLSDGAKYYWKLFKQSVHNDLICSQFSENIKSFFRKLGEHAARLAGLFHYFEGQGGDVSPNAMKSAIALCEWYAYEFVRAFSRFAPSQEQMQGEAAEKLFAWLQHALAYPARYSKITAGRYTERDLNNYSSIRNDPATLAVAINVLEQQGRVATAYGKKGGRIVFYPPWMKEQFSLSSPFLLHMNQPYVNYPSPVPVPDVIKHDFSGSNAVDNCHHHRAQTSGAFVDDLLKGDGLLASKIRVLME